MQLHPSDGHSYRYNSLKYSSYRTFVRYASDGKKVHSFLDYKMTPETHQWEVLVRWQRWTKPKIAGCLRVSSWMMYRCNWRGGYIPMLGGRYAKFRPQWNFKWVREMICVMCNFYKQ